MSSILLSTLLVGVAIFLLYIKDEFKYAPLSLIALMFALDGLIIYCFTLSSVTKPEIAVGIMTATVLRTLLFVVTLKRNE